MQDYFDFFDIEEAIFIDEAALKTRFYQNSKTFHPDFYTLAGEEKQTEILALASLNNEAYKTLKNLDLRVHYILVKNGVLAEEGNNTVPQDFLMEMMDINEKIMELSMEGDQQAKEEVIQEVQGFKNDLEEQVNSIDTIADKDLRYAALKDYYLKKKYLNRLLENISGL